MRETEENDNFNSMFCFVASEKKEDSGKKNKELPLKLKGKVKILGALTISIRCYHEKLHVWTLNQPALKMLSSFPSQVLKEKIC